MPESGISADFLSDLIEGRASSFGQPSPEADLARLAAACREISVPGPAPVVVERLLERFETLLAGPRWQWWQGWIGPAPRPFVQRMAAGVVLLVASGGGASAAAGVPPQELAADAAGFVRSVVVNLAPRDGGDEPPPVTPVLSPAATASASPAPTQTPPAPSATGSPPQGAVPTAEADPEPGDDDTRTPEPGDDNSGPGSGNSGSGSDNSGSGSQNSGSGSSGGDD